jgi:GNAT superfamily N-acetyltransferase
MFDAEGIEGYRNMVNLNKYVVVGMIKVGPKKLFLNDEAGRQLELTPLCVLDFFIHEKMQRQGYGKQLFDFMLSVMTCNRRLNSSSPLN